MISKVNEGSVNNSNITYGNLPWFGGFVSIEWSLSWESGCVTTLPFNVTLTEVWHKRSSTREEKLTLRGIEHGYKGSSVAKMHFSFSLIDLLSLWFLYSKAGFFLTSAVGKTKTQAQNSSQKLKLREAFPKKVKKTQEKSQFWSFFKWGGTCFAIFINKYFQLQES